MENNPVEIYQFDARGVFTGETKVIGFRDGCPPNWTRTPMPDAADPSKDYRFTGTGWEEVDLPPLPTPEQLNQVRALTPLQVRMYLHEKDLLSSVQPQIDSISDPDLKQRTQLMWDYAEVFRLNNPELIALAAGLGIDSEGLKAMFNEANVER